MFTPKNPQHSYQTASFGPLQTVSITKNISTSFTLIHDNQGNMLRKYEVNPAHFSQQSQLFDWRKQIHHPIPKITLTKTGLDLHKKIAVSVFCEHISTNFADIPLLRVESIVYSLSQMLLGYQEILSRLGFVCIQPRLCGLTAKGQLLIWINQNLLSNVAQHRKLTTENQIVRKIIQLLQAKAEDRYDLFFNQLRKLQPKFKNVLEFIMNFKQKFKLKIIPKIIPIKSALLTEKMITSNTFSNKSQKQFVEKNIKSQQFSMKTSENIRSSHSQSQFLPASRKNQTTDNFYFASKNFDVRTSIMQNNQSNTPKNAPNSVYQKSGPKVNFSYSQKRQDISTPKQSEFIRDYASDKNMPLLGKNYSEYNPIQQFTLDDKKSNADISDKPNKKPKYERKIVPTYSIYYLPQNDTSYVKTQQDLKKSSTSQFSQSSFNQKDRLIRNDSGYNKASMTTNHRSAVTQSFQSFGKYSNDDESFNRKDDLFASNNSHKTTFSIIKNSFVQNQPGRNTTSFVVLGNYDKTPHSALNYPALAAQNSHKNQKRNDMYTFGGLIQTTEVPCSPSNRKNLAFETKNRSPVQRKADLNVNASKELNNQINTKSIEELYNNLYFYSQKKSMIMEQSQYEVKLSPVKQENQSYSQVKRSFVNLQNERDTHGPISHQKNPASRRQFSFSTPKIQQTIAFDYNQWRGIKGLLNQSNCYELKQSFHCGPQIRSPVNIKLQLLGKFGRDIGQSIIPSTPSISMGKHSRVYSTCTQDQNQDFY